MLIWGGYKFTDRTAAAGGGSFDPIAKTWEKLAGNNEPDPAGFRGTALAWTGKEVLVVGGASHLKDVFAYKPATNSWNKLSAAAPFELDFPCAVWVGTELFAFNRSGVGAAYAPATDRWRTLKSGASHVNVGTSILTCATDGKSVFLYVTSLDVTKQLVSYNIKADTWTSHDMTGGPVARSHASIVWVGEALFLYGGYGQGVQAPEAFLFFP